MDFMCLCFAYVKAIMVGVGWLDRRDCMSIMAVCMSRVFRIIALMHGWVYDWE